MSDMKLIYIKIDIEWDSCMILFDAQVKIVRHVSIGNKYIFSIKTKVINSRLYSYNKLVSVDFS